MKAKLFADGTLVVSAEDELEAFALSAWQRHKSNGTAKLVIDTSSERLAWDAIKEFNETFSSMGQAMAELKKWKEATKTGTEVTTE